MSSTLALTLALALALTLTLTLTRRAAPLLARSRAYLSVGHDEYWTYAQRAAIEAARDRPRGLHLNFWSANEAYWAVRLERSRYEAADAAEEEPPRTVVCYKETQVS